MARPRHSHDTQTHPSIVGAKLSDACFTGDPHEGIKEAKQVGQRFLTVKMQP